MHRTRSILVLMFVAALAAGGCAANRPSTRPPNIILVFADDLGRGELGCYGQTKIRTPHIDRLAAEGVRFDNFYDAAPVCAPCRGSIMTGLHLGHAFVRDNVEIQPEGQLPLPPGTVTLASRLREAGYATGIVGKWGLGGPGSGGEPLDMGFDRFFGYLCQRHAHNHYPPYLWSDRTRVEYAGNTKGNLVGQVYSQDRFIEEAEAFVRAHADGPFFLYLPWIIPHLALQAPQEEIDAYTGAFPEAPYDGKNGYLPHPTPRAAYAAMVTRMDKDVGRIVALIDELGLDENTLIIFTSDNGPALDVGGADSTFFNSTGGMRGRKGSLWEGGIRAPFVARWPSQIPPGSTTAAFGATYDLLPTFLELAAAPSAEDIDGVSLASVLRGGPAPDRDTLYWEFPGYGGQQAVRWKNWKAIRQNLHKSPTPWMLFDLASDPNETTDVAADNPEVLQSVREVAAREHAPSQRFPIAVLDDRKE